MKKTLIFMAVLSLLLVSLPMGWVTAATDPAFYITAGTGCVDGTVTVDVGVRNNPGVVSFVLSVDYDDTVLTLVDAAPLQFTSMVLSPTEQAPLIVNWCEGDREFNVAANGAILRLTFAVNAAAAVGSYPISLSYSQEDTFNVDFADVVFTTEDGAVTLGRHAYDNACDTTCNVCGGARATEHVYDNDTDASCNVCGDIRYVKYSLHTGNGTSVTEELRGLAFHFTTPLTGAAMDASHRVDYSNATVVPDSTTPMARVVAMGAVVSNDPILGELNLSQVDDRYTKNIPIQWLMTAEEDAVTYAVRIKYIPDGKRDAVVRVRPYLVYLVDGNYTVVYGDEVTASINSTLENANL